jgi:deoxyribodipyrimidine photo-lyase
MQQKVNVFWFRRDLRLWDNKGLFEALRSSLPVLPLFIFDQDILEELTDCKDRRVQFIYNTVMAMQEILIENGSTLTCYYGKPVEIFTALTEKYAIATVFTNHDYEPYAVRRDEEVKQSLGLKGINFKTFKDQVIFEKSEVVKDGGDTYAVFTPYSKKWKILLTDGTLVPFPSEKLLHNFYKQDPLPVPTVESMGFEPAAGFLPIEIDPSIIQNYHQTRDIPSLAGTTRMGVHLRFGTVSVRKIVAMAKDINEIFLNELIWREFFMQALWHQPRLEHQCFKQHYDRIQWRNNEEEFEKWKSGMTGYPIVDAGMRELNATGFMHNRVRMVTASFLVKHLLIDWRWGEAYFASKLLDYELASNIGNWQWVAGCGCDAAPYFRIFSPDAQTKKFDGKYIYIKKWVPEIETFEYPLPIVDHAFARERCLRVFKASLGAGQ